MTARECAQPEAAGAQEQTIGALMQRGGAGVVRVDEQVALGLHERVGVLRVALAQGDEQALVVGDRLEQRLHRLEPERQRVVDELGIVVGREHVGARRERVGDAAHSHALEGAARQEGERGDRGERGEAAGQGRVQGGPPGAAARTHGRRPCRGDSARTLARSGRARQAVGLHQRMTQPPHAKPAPNAASTMRSPSRTRPASRASVSAIGMLAAVVLP